MTSRFLHLSLVSGLVVLVFWGLSDVAYASNCQHDDTSFRCVKVLRNYDADTLTVDIPGLHPLIGKNISVRVRGIDAPEIKGQNQCEKDAARTAKRLVENLLKNAKRVDLVEVDRDKYFRVLADVQVDGQDLKSILIKNRLAYNYGGGKKRNVNWCEFQRSPASK